MWGYGGCGRKPSARGRPALDSAWVQPNGAKSTALLTGKDEGAVWPVQVARRKAVMQYSAICGRVLLKVGVVKGVWRVVVEVIRSNPKAVKETFPVGSMVHLRVGWRAFLAGGGGVVV